MKNTERKRYTSSFIAVSLGWFKKIKSVQIYSASILCGALLHKDYWNIFIFSQKWVLRVSQGGSIFKKVDFQDVPNYPMWVL